MSFELLRHTRAKIIRGENGDDEVMIRFPVIQLAIMWGLALAVTFGVWLSNRDLGFTVLLRERAQHRDEGWPGWLSWHRVIEGFAWGVGAQIVWLTLWLIGG